MCLVEFLLIERNINGCLEVDVQMHKDMELVFHWEKGGSLLIQAQISGTKAGASILFELQRNK
jgi:hypothetical protein